MSGRGRGGSDSANLGGLHGEIARGVGYRFNRVGRAGGEGSKGRDHFAMWGREWELKEERCLQGGSRKERTN